MLYDPGLVSLILVGIPIVGFQKGTFIVAKRTSDTFKVEVGSQGDSTTVRSRDKTGEIEVTLMAESPSNQALSTLHAADELTGVSIGPSMAVDVLGTTEVFAAMSRIKKVADVEFSGEATARKWTIICAPEIEINAGMAVVPG